MIAASPRSCSCRALLSHTGPPPRGSPVAAAMKRMVLDGATVITGSFNFTKAADEENAENLIIIEGKPKIAAAYARNFEAHLGHSTPFGK